MKTLLIIISILCSLPLIGQNRFNLTQYMIHQPLINFASISSKSNIDAAILHRAQWIGFEGAPSTTMFSLSSPIKTTNLSIGGVAYHDQIGANAVTNVDLGLSYRLQLNTNNYLALALKGGISNVSTDYSMLTLEESNDLSFQNGASQIQSDFGFSAYFFSEKYYLGFAIPSLVRGANYYQGDQLVLPQDFHYFTTLGYQLDLGRKYKLGLSSLVKGVLNAPLQVDLNAQLMYNELVGIGASYRTSDDVAAMLIFNIKDRFTISYSYDIGFSDLARYHDNTHEILLIFNAPTKNLVPLASPRF